MKVKIKKINAFTDSISAGNPAGVVLNSPNLTNRQMKLISKIIKVSETAFVFPSDLVNFDVRFFSPKMEVDLCGHATIATYYGMLMENYFTKKKFISIKQNTNSGIIPIEIYYKKNGNFDKIMMIQNNPDFKDVNTDFSEIADALNISKESINQKFPKQTASTGLYTLPICIDSFNKIKKIRPNFNKIKKICKKYNVGSIHIFTFDTIESDSIYHSRNFAPLYGINEDPVTGTANGAVCSYLFFNKIIEKNELICEQGDIIKRSGRVFVNVKDNKIKVGGRAKFVEEIELNF